MQTYYLNQNGEESGPYTLDQLKGLWDRAEIKADTYYWTEGLEEWTLINELEELVTTPNPIQTQPTIASGETKEGLAITSLVTGILSFLGLPFIASIVAVITGHKALKKAKTLPEQYSGRGLAKAGLILGYINIVLIVTGFFLILLLPLTLGNVKEEAKTMSSKSQASMIAKSYYMYTTVRAKYPTQLADLENLGLQADELSSPFGPDDEFGYEIIWLRGPRTHDPSSTIIVKDKYYRGSNGEKIVGYLDGSSMVTKE